MDSKKKSALTAALSAPGNPDAGSSDKGSLGKDDISSFPCLGNNKDSDQSQELAKEFKSMDLERRNSLAGSAPTKTGLTVVTVSYVSFIAAMCLFVCS